MKSKSYYNKTYKLLSNNYNDEIAHSLIVEWRANNIYALNKGSKLIERVIKKVNLKNCYVGQRLKRLNSIKSKLIRSSGMRLTHMQDIAGVRLVVNDLGELEQVVQQIKKERFLGKNLSIYREYDYIKNPKDDGYRSYHIVFKVVNIHKGVEQNRYFELQLRTKSQHAWSTVVETIGAYLDIDFKGGDGDFNWKLFFSKSSYMFSWFERIEYGKIKINGDDIKEIIQSSIKLKEVMLELQVVNLLKFLNSITAKVVFELNESKQKDYAIVVIDYLKKEGSLRTYPKSSYKTASNIYEEIEKEIRHTNQIQALFVELTSLTNLRKAFPNFYIDVSEFNYILQSYFNKLNDYIEEFS